MAQKQTKYLLNTERIPTVEAHYHLVAKMMMGRWIMMMMVMMVVVGGDDDVDDDGEEDKEMEGHGSVWKL